MYFKKGLEVIDRKHIAQGYLTPLIPNTLQILCKPELTIQLIFNLPTHALKF